MNFIPSTSRLALQTLVSHLAVGWCRWPAGFLVDSTSFQPCLQISSHGCIFLLVWSLRMLPLSLARRITLSPPPRPWQLPITALPRQPAALIYFPMGDSPEPEFMLYFRWNFPRVFIRFLPLRRVAKEETDSTTGWRLNIKLGSIGGEKVAVFFTITFICARDKCGKYR